MSEVRLGGDSSDSVSEMGDPEKSQNNKADNSADEAFSRNYKADFIIEEHEPLALKGYKQVDKYRSIEAGTATCVTTDQTADNNDALKERCTDNSANKVKVHARQLFIGNLPFRVRWQDLKDMFKKAGDVVRADVAIGYDSRSKGHGTVLFTTIQDAQNAVDLFHNYAWQGRVLEVREDRGYIDKEAHGGNQYRHRGHGGGLTKATSTKTIFPASGIHVNPLYINQAQSAPLLTPGRNQLFVGNIPFSCQWQDLKDLFRNAGNILRADIAQGQDGRSRGFGTVLYATIEDAQNAVAMYDGYDFHGRQLRVHFDKFAPVPPSLMPGQLVTNVHESHFKHPPQLQPSSYQSFMPISSQTLPGMHSHQSQLQNHQYYPNSHTIGNMPIPPQHQLPNAILHNPHSMVQSDRISGASPSYTQIDHANTSSALVPGAVEGSLFGPSDVPIGPPSGIENGRMSFTDSAPWSPNTAAWDQRHLDGTYRQLANGSRPLQYPWQTYPHQQPFGYPSYMALPTSQPEYLSESHIPNNLRDNAQSVDAVAMDMANLRFESTAGLSQNNMDNIPVDNLNVDLTPPAGMGGIGLNDPMWERQEGNWAPSLTSSFKL